MAMGEPQSIEDAARVVYARYGNNLSAFWRDAFAAETQRHGDDSDPYVVDGNCIHYIPICRRCQLATIHVHLREKEQIETTLAISASSEAAREIAQCCQTWATTDFADQENIDHLASIISRAIRGKSNG